MMKINNPLNIKWNPANCWNGQTGHHNGFCVFDSTRNGIRAAFVLLRTYWNKYHLKSIRQIITRWAPYSENPTDSYIEFICLKFTDHYNRSRVFDADEPLGKTFNTALPRLALLLKFMSDFESPNHGIEIQTFIHCGKTLES